jgi:hypothetical protein
MAVLRSTVQSFCAMERAALEKQLDLLRSLEEAAVLQQPEEDIALFISQTRQLDLTHRYHHALALMEDRLILRYQREVLFTNIFVYITSIHI